MDNISNIEFDNDTLLYIAILIALVIFGVFYYIRKSGIKFESAKKIKAHEKIITPEKFAMAKQDVQFLKKQGMTDRGIRTSLKLKGWNDSMIDGVLKK